MTRSTIRNRKFKQPLIILFWLLIWEAVFLIINKEIYLPSPLSAFETLFSLLSDGETYIVIGHSMLRTVSALLLSVGLGVSLGILCGLYPSVHDLLNPLVVVLRSMPIASIIIIAIIWFRSTNVPIFAGFLMCFPLIFTSSVAGIRNTDEKLLEMCRIYRVRKADVVRSVYFRSAVPYINAGLVSSLGIAWKAIAAAEVLALPRYSIGFHLYQSKTWLDPASLFAWTIVIIALSYLFEFLFVKVSGYDKTGKRI